MGGKNAIIGILAILTVLLGGIVIWQHGQLLAVVQAESAQEARNAELQKKVESLEQEIATLKETADYYLRLGVDQQSTGNLREAKATFEAVIAKFPTSNLVGSARQRLAAVNEAIAKAEAYTAAQEKEAEAARLAEKQQEQREKLAKEQGEPIEYSIFYARYDSDSLPIDKRFRFVATVSPELILAPQEGMGGSAIGGRAAFDDNAQYEHFVQNSTGRTTHTIVASMGNDKRVHIHKIRFATMYANTPD